MDYYLKHHIPTTEAAWSPFGVISCTVCGIEDGANYAFVVVLAWKNVALWEVVNAREAAKELAADAENFTSVVPIILAGRLSTDDSALTGVHVMY